MTLSVLPVFVSGTFTSHTSSSNKQIHPEFFSLKKDNRTRKHKVKLKDQCKLLIRQYLFPQNTINEWNKIVYILCNC